MRDDTLESIDAFAASWALLAAMKTAGRLARSPHLREHERATYTVWRLSGRWLAAVRGCAR